jgi:hypothetical protein
VGGIVTLRYGGTKALSRAIDVYFSLVHFFLCLSLSVSHMTQ